MRHNYIHSRNDTFERVECTYCGHSKSVRHTKWGADGKIEAVIELDTSAWGEAINENVPCLPKTSHLFVKADRIIEFLDEGATIIHADENSYLIKLPTQPDDHE